MPNFLWVEDFPTEGEKHVTVDNVFGGLIKTHNLSKDPTGYQIRKFLAPSGIHLELTLSAAVRFISDPDKLRAVDFIVLDIDVNPYGEIESDHDKIDGIITKWYGYEYGSFGTPDFDEKKFQAACDKLKKEAGYHLWAMLVVEMSFPRDRILFCSDHGDQIQSIKNSFFEAKLVPPEVFTKSDEYVKQWIADKASDAYVGFRRSVVNTCDDLLLKLQPEDFRLTKLPGRGAERLTALAAAEALDLWPSLLPFNPESSRIRSRSLRQFVGNIVHLWEAINTSAMWQEKQPKWLCSFADEMKFVRNAMSHSTSAFGELSTAEAAFIFLINCRAMFELGDELRDFEASLLNLVGSRDSISKNEHSRSTYTSAKPEVDVLWSKYKEKLENRVRKASKQPWDYSKIYHSDQKLTELLGIAAPEIIDEPSAYWVIQLFFHHKKQCCKEKPCDNFLQSFDDAAKKLSSPNVL